MLQIQDDGEIEINCASVKDMLVQASSLLMEVSRKAVEVTENYEYPSQVLNDIFKSLKFTLLLERGMTEEEAFEYLKAEDERSNHSS
jgi:hypothetical protein